jgi:hypothetical protein
VKRLRKLALAALAMTIALVSAELAARALAPPPEYMPNLLFDPEFGFRTKPDLRLTTRDEAGPMEWATNSLGFLGPELPDPDAHRSERRVLFLGDSFLHVWNVRLENALTAVAADRLTRAGPRAVAWNLSCRGWGTNQELLALRSFGARVRPEDVVLCVFPSNDLANNELELADLTNLSPGDFLHPYLVPEEDGLELSWSQPVRSFLRRRSRLFGLLDVRVQLFARQRELDWLLYGVPAPLPAERAARGLSPFEDLECFRQHGRGDPWERAWTTTEALILETRRETLALGARFLMVVIPHAYQVHSDARRHRRERLLRRHGLAGLDTEHDWNLPETRLARFAAEHGIEVVILLERLREAARTGADTYQSNGHLNTLGNRVAGEAIAEHLLAPAPRSDPVPLGAPVEAPPDPGADPGDDAGAR